MTFYEMTAPARYDTLRSGLVPCKVVGLDDHDRMATIRITKTQGAYRRGEVLQAPLSYVVPAGAVRYRKYSTVIRAYKWYRGEHGPAAVIQPDISEVRL